MRSALAHELLLLRSGMNRFALLVCALVASTACNAAVGEPQGEREEAPAPVDAGGEEEPDQDESPLGPDAAPVAVTLSQSTSEEITPIHSVACVENDANGNPIRHLENSVYRLFNLEELGVTGRLEVSSVKLAIESASSPEGSQPATVRLHTVSGNNFTLDRMTEIASAELTIPDQEAQYLEVPLTATVEAGSRLAVEVHVPESVATTRLFFVGANGGGQSGPSYLRATACGLVEPTDLASIAFPEVHMVLSISGTAY